MFGGFTTLPWNSIEHGEYGTDKDAFLFLIRSSSDYPSGIFDIWEERAKYAIQNQSKSGYICCFGQDYGGNEIFIQASKSSRFQQMGAENGDDYKIPKGEGVYYLLGNDGTWKFHSNRLEVFQMEYNG